MNKLNPKYIERVNQLANSCPYFDLLSMKICDVGIGYSVIEIDLAQKHLQPFGNAHGGVFASIIDAASFWSLYYDIEDQDAGLTTVDLKLNFLLPARSGKLIAKGRRIKMGKTLGYAQAEVRNQKGTMVAQGTSIVIIQPGKGLPAKEPLPPKFIE
jgi:uncharacterized protein (TIGR00369 family)